MAMAARHRDWPAGQRQVAMDRQDRSAGSQRRRFRATVFALVGGLSGSIRSWYSKGREQTDEAAGGVDPELT